MEKTEFGNIDKQLMSLGRIHATNSQPPKAYPNIEVTAPRLKKKNAMPQALTDVRGHSAK